MPLLPAAHLSVLKSPPMAKTSKPVDAAQFEFGFGSNFLRDHAGQLMTDPRVAIVELIANSYDAGAMKVDIRWPATQGEVLSIKDDGVGMTLPEFLHRWGTLCYDRLQEQGPDVEFPPGVPKRSRSAFGHNGKGRHAALCFADEYRVETRKDGESVRALVSLTTGGPTPFACAIEQRSAGEGHGTTIHAVANRNVLPADSLTDVIGTKFAVDPSFEIRVNSKRVRLFDISVLKTETLKVDGVGDIRIHMVDAQEPERTMHLKGITWWVNSRMVGEPSWDGLDQAGHFLDGRTTEAKRFSFVVEADVLRKDVKPDWTGFHPSSRFNGVRDAVLENVIRALGRVLASNRKQLKKATLEQHKALLRDLPLISKHQVAKFVDEVQEKCPNLSPRDLSRTVEIYGKLEQARSGYDLLAQLEACSPEDLDTWNQLMQRWTAGNAEVVLNELDRRLRVVAELQKLIRDRKSDEVHDLQPLFERGLWMFGPEYESVDFRANRGMAEVVTSLFQKRGVTVSRRRPDFVALSDSSIAFYSADQFGPTGGEVTGVRKVLVVELKKGGFALGQAEVDQARDYVLELRKVGAIQPTTDVEAFVLGAELQPGLSKLKYGDRDETVIQPLVYDILLNRAHVRTFNLQRKLQDYGSGLGADAELEEVLSSPDTGELFGSSE